MARLSPHEKFDPLPVYIALQRAQEGAGRRLHLVLYGDFPDGYSKGVFLQTASRLMPDVTLHHMPHGGAARRRAALSAAEMFLFPIDNLQESFGIAPVEAMAAGLPVIASDWDGIRDTVDGGAGIRIPTTGARPEHVEMTGRRYHGGTDSYVQYLGQRSAVIPQMQDLFAELDARRRAADPARHPPVARGMLPVAPSPMAYFESFPTGLLPAGATFRWTGHALPVGEVFDLRNYAPTRRLFERRADVERVADALRNAGRATAADLARESGFGVLKAERCLLWLAKYGFAEREG